VGLLTKPEQPWCTGGVGRFCGTLVRALSRRGDTEIILLVHEKPEFDLDVPHVRVRVIEPPISKGLPYLSRVINKRIDQRNFEYQGKTAILFYSMKLTSNLAARLKAQHIPAVIWVNSDLAADDGKFNSEYLQKQYREYLNAADVIVAQNSYQVQGLQRYYHRETAMITAGIIDSSMPTAGPVPTIVPSSNKRPQLLWVGRSAGIKRPWVLEQIANRLPEFSLIAVLSKELDDQLYRTVIYDLERCDNVTLIPTLAHEDLIALYHEDIIAINTSASEGLPNTFLEAANASRPFISMDIDLDGLLSGHAGNGAIGLCAHGDLDLMCQMIRDLASDPGRRQRIGQAAHDYVFKHWDADKVAAQWVELMDTLAAS